MAFVTKYAYDKLVGSIELKDFNEKWTKDTFEEKNFANYNLFYWFNNLERNRLYIYRYLLENNGALPAYNIVEEEPDTETYVFMTGGKLKYHLYHNCNSFKDNYVYFKIPPEISEERKELISTFRGWFKTRKFKEQIELGEIIDSDILKLYNEVFVKTHFLNQITDFTFIEKSKNSGIEYTADAFDINSFKERISHLNQKRYDLCNSRTMFSISRLDYLKDRPKEEIYRVITERAKHTDAYTKEFIDNFGIDRLRNFWIEHYQIKCQVEKLLKEYFRWTYNFNNTSFEKITLDNFGLTCCKICESRQPF